MKRYDLIAFDMDGTMLTSDQTISARTQSALDEAINREKTVIICTGRTYRELMDYDMTELRRVRYYVCENGALIYDSINREVISATCIPDELVQYILNLAEQADMMLCLASNGQNMLNREDAHRMEYFHAERYKDIELRSGVLCDDIISSFREKPDPVEKMNLYSATVEIRDKLYRELEKLPLTIVFAEETGLEITPLHMSKAAGMKKLCEYLNIPMERTIAVGDSDNDIEMMKTAGLAVAMGNARTCITEICDVTVADNDHDGCAEAIEKYLL